MATEPVFKELLPKYDLVADFIQKYRPTSLCDWGCAQGNLILRVQQEFEWCSPVVGFDPANQRYNQIPPGNYDCLVSCDVVEHFEPHELTTNLKLMQSKFRRAAYIIAACYPAKKFLSDGRNAHLIQESQRWWLDRITQDFDQCQVIWWSMVDYPSRRGPCPELRVIVEKTCKQ